MSRKNKNKNQNQNRVTKEDTPSEPKKSLKAVPVWKDSNGDLLKLKRADFPYNRNGIIAYCDYRIEYWKIKKQEMLKKADPVNKFERKRIKLVAALAKVNAQIKEQGGPVETDQKTNS